MTQLTTYVCPVCGYRMAAGVVIGGPPKCPRDGTVLNQE